jgi:hypothetical protein
MILEEQTRTVKEARQSDSRQALRAPIMVLQTDAPDGHKRFFGYAKNLSKSGMMIGTINPREPGSRFWVEFPLPDPVNRVATCHCEVVWQRRYSREHRYDPGMGLRFLDLPEDMAEAIDEWVRELERQELLLS